MTVTSKQDKAMKQKSCAQTENHKPADLKDAEGPDENQTEEGKKTEMRQRENQPKQTRRQNYLNVQIHEQTSSRDGD